MFSVNSVPFEAGTVLTTDAAWLPISFWTKLLE